MLKKYNKSITVFDPCPVHIPESYCKWASEDVSLCPNFQKEMVRDGFKKPPWPLQMFHEEPMSSSYSRFNLKSLGKKETEKKRWKKIISHSLLSWTLKHPFRQVTVLRWDLALRRAHSFTPKCLLTSIISLKGFHRQDSLQVEKGGRGDPVF